ncbi:MAG: CBS domain-containing protein [Elusimicrobia bacterium]|nr:CBS domain-containing protein [Elusimicrobiota bacterium]
MNRFSDKVAQVLDAKGTDVVSVDPDSTVFDAIRLMAERGIGAVLVLSGSRLVGILSERDYARKIILEGRRSADTKVSQVMTAHVLSVPPTASVEGCLKLMTVKRFRHLPVVEGAAVRGVVSIGDLVKWVVMAQGETIRQLEDYIAGRYPG